MSDFTPTPTPSYSGKLRNHMLMVPECIEECSGIRIFGRTIKSFVFSTDVATIASCNADAVIAVYPFTPQPRIARAIISVADMPVFCGVGGGFTSGARSVAQAMEAEHCGAYGVVLNAPVSADIMRDIRAHIDIPVVATIVSATQDTEARIAAGADILNVSAAAETPQLVAALRARHPEIPIIATGGPRDETIRKTIAAGANAITYTPPDNGVLLADIMTAREEFGDMRGRKLTFFGDARNNVANSLIVVSAKLGMHFCACGPKELMPEEWLIEKCRAVAAETGAVLEFTDDVAQGAKDCDVLYTDIWLSMGEPAELWEKRIKLLRPYQVNKELMAMAKPTAIFEHCLPSFHDRETTVGEDIYQKFGLEAMEVTDDVFLGHQARQFQEAENRMHTIKAVMYATLK